MECIPITELGVKALRKMSRGTLRRVVKADIEEPTIAIVDYYDTVRFGTLAGFVVVLPAKEEVVYREGDYYDVYYLPRLKKKVTIEYGSAEWPGEARVEEMTEEDYRELERLRKIEEAIGA